MNLVMLGKKVRPERFPTLEDTDGKTALELNVYEELVLVAAVAGFEIKQPETALAYSFEEVEAVIGWICAIYASANDNIVHKKRLVQPEHAKGVVEEG